MQTDDDDFLDNTGRPVPKTRSEPMSDRDSILPALTLSTIGTLLVLALLAGGMYGCPQYGVYSQRLEGEAELAKAEYSKQVAVQTATAKKASAQLEADAEVIRAGGVAKANAIIGDSLKGNEAYLKYLWITDVAGAKAPSVIYVPTEANIPILEAGKRPPTVEK